MKFLATVLLLLSRPSSAYDIGCIYPKQSPDPWNVRERLSTFGSQSFNSMGMETPMVVRSSLYGSGGCPAMCLHLHDQRVADPFTGVPLPLTLPDYMQNAFSIAMCTVQCNVHLTASIAPAFIEAQLEWIRTDLKMVGVKHPSEAEEVGEAVLEYYEEGDSGPMLDIVRENDHPLMMGHIAGFRVVLIAEADGWNSQGDLQYSKAEDAIVPCTGSCRKFQDTSGYAPKPNPRTFPYLDMDKDKYKCTGLCRKWQPLQEGSPEGSMQQQEFVVPHIGRHAVTYLRNVTETLVDPEYDIYQESLQVIEELRLTSLDDYRKQQVRTMDDKLNVRYIIRLGMREKFRNNMSFQDYILFVHGMSSAEYDAVVQTWHEKRIHDIVRPTTFIKNLDNDTLTTFGGDIDHNGPVEIAARDFEALIRVMPHPEFPSGSSCLCSTYMEYVDEYTTRHLNGTIENIEAFDHTYANMTEVSNICAESRLWGGMHFKAAIPAGVKICAGLGRLGVDFVDSLKDDTVPFIGDLYYRDGKRPQCNVMPERKTGENNIRHRN